MKTMFSSETVRVSGNDKVLEACCEHYPIMRGLLKVVGRVTVRSALVDSVVVAALLSFIVVFPVAVVAFSVLEYIGISAVLMRIVALGSVASGVLLTLITERGMIRAVVGAERSGEQGVYAKTLYCVSMGLVAEIVVVTAGMLVIATEALLVLKALHVFTP